MADLINGRKPEAIKIGLRNMLETCADACGVDDTLCREMCCPYDGDGNCHETILMGALAYIERLEVALKCEQVARDVLMEDMPKWIGVKERLPEHRQHVYACAKDKFRFEGIYIDPVGFERYEIGEGWVNENQNVTHWMPLPEPPEEDA